MSEFTPNDREIRDWIVTVDALAGHGGESVRRFDRWLANHDAEKWDEGAKWAAVELDAIPNESAAWLAPGDNPYREADDAKRL